MPTLDDRDVILPGWLEPGPDACAACGRGYHAEVGYRCAACDRALCPACAVFAGQTALCPECAAEERR